MPLVGQIGSVDGWPQPAMNALYPVRANLIPIAITIKPGSSSSSPSESNQSGLHKVSSIARFPSGMVARRRNTMGSQYDPAERA
ncbi:hypothetical protein M2281_003942 [Mesorhizobium soli]|nr:hypothetical protein [Mesorhizobium soli]